jgi:steroid delta-isomerase-like uncharacterized protein
MSEANKELMQRWFQEVWTSGRASAIDEMFAENGVAHGLSGDDSDLHGPAEYKPFFETFRSGFPNLVIDVDDLIAEGDKVAVRFTLRAKHEGECLGVKPTHRPVVATGLCIARIEEGKIAEAWNAFDFMTVLRQMDALPAINFCPASAAGES